MSGPFGFTHALNGSGPGVLADAGPDDSLVEQLAALYEEKQELQSALGVSTAAEIVALVQSAPVDSMAESLVQQLHAIYAEQEELQAAVGCSTPAEVLALVAQLRASIRALVDESRRRLDYEASLLETHERFLA